jgi:hypothetical protein
MIFTKQDWLDQCRRLLPESTEAEREKLYEDTIAVEPAKPDFFLLDLIRDE